MVALSSPLSWVACLVALEIRGKGSHADYCWKFTSLHSLILEALKRLLTVVTTRLHRKLAPNLGLQHRPYMEALATCKPPVIGLATPLVVPLAGLTQVHIHVSHEPPLKPLSHPDHSEFALWDA